MVSYRLCQLHFSKRRKTVWGTSHEVWLFWCYSGSEENCVGLELIPAFRCKWRSMLSNTNKLTLRFTVNSNESIKNFHYLLDSFFFISMTNSLSILPRVLVPYNCMHFHYTCSASWDRETPCVKAYLFLSLFLFFSTCLCNLKPLDA